LVQERKVRTRFLPALPARRAAIRAAADQVAEGSEQLEEDGGWTGFAVGSECADDAAGDAVESGWLQGVVENWPGPRWRLWIGCGRLGVGFTLRLLGKAEELRSAALNFGEGG
jgi:hypothetical protein